LAFFVAAKKAFLRRRQDITSQSFFAAVSPHVIPKVISALLIGFMFPIREPILIPGGLPLQSVLTLPQSAGKTRMQLTIFTPQSRNRYDVADDTEALCHNIGLFDGEEKIRAHCRIRAAPSKLRQHKQGLVVGQSEEEVLRGREPR
jgi:hypothetical protein